jgi:hypothetical protein
LSRPPNYGANTERSPHINMHSPLHPLHGPCAGLEDPPHLPHRVANILMRLRRVTSMVVESFSTLTDTTTAINRYCQELLDVMDHYLPEHFETRRECLMFEALCLAAKVYIKCISQGTKFSEGFPKLELQNLQDILSTLSRSVWDTVPGVFLFILWRNLQPDFSWIQMPTSPPHNNVSWAHWHS